MLLLGTKAFNQTFEYTLWFFWSRKSDALEISYILQFIKYEFEVGILCLLLGISRNAAIRLRRINVISSFTIKRYLNFMYPYKHNINNIKLPCVWRKRMRNNRLMNFAMLDAAISYALKIIVVSYECLRKVQFIIKQATNSGYGTKWGTKMESDIIALFISTPPFIYMRNVLLQYSNVCFVFWHF